MVVSDATRARARRENAPAVGPSAPLAVEDASESSRAGPRPVGVLQREPPTYVTVDALQGLMSTMADAIMRQVTEQVQRALGMNDARNLPNPPRHLGSRAASPREELGSLRSRGLAQEGRSYQVPHLQDERQKDHASVDVVGRSGRGRSVASATASTPYATHSRPSGWLQEQEHTSRLIREQSRGHRRSPEHRSNRDRARSPPVREAGGYELRIRDRSPHRALHPIEDRRSPSVVEVERRRGTPIKVSGTAARLVAPSFSTPFCPEIINAPRCGKVKMPMVDLYDGTGDPEEHLGVQSSNVRSRRGRCLVLPLLPRHPKGGSAILVQWSSPG